MALVTLQRSPTPSAASSASTTNSSAGEDFGSDDDRKNNQSCVGTMVETGTRNREDRAGKDPSGLQGEDLWSSQV
ncbi:hypothetical protein D4764_20G0000970 [Takifugu flavidus]|uniref:Uncharacterized protein n=1 Tax=Takifugu flavidus TaxID=433684 RepID=A0A5C6NGC2_9TELE|nr:hypothetical protein D4764_20G0000970 [Takifugu flavidus]